MRVVVSDTSPLHYLILIGEVELLRVLFQEIQIPPRVVEELSRPSAPAQVRSWAASLPAWVTVRAPIKSLSRAQLDAGECEALALALESKADRVLLDDLAGRAACRELGLVPLGTPGILEEASRRGLVELTECVTRLLATNFRASPALVRAVLARRTPEE